MTTALRYRFCVYLLGTYYVQCTLLSMAVGTKVRRESQVVSRSVEDGGNYKMRQGELRP